jgi:hypothetical protein
MISTELNQTLNGINLSNAIAFIKGFIKGRPTKENPFWVKIRQIIEKRQDQFLEEFGTGDFREVIKIINQM